MPKLSEPEVVHKDIPTGNPEVKTVIVKVTRTNDENAVLEYIPYPGTCPIRTEH